MADPYLGEIRLFPFPVVPSGWVQCNGQVLPINNYKALYALLGTRYGGDGKTTFGIPDLCGRAPRCQTTNSSTAPKTTPVVIGEKNGAEGIALTQAQIPPHIHTINVTTTPGTVQNIVGNIYGSVAVPAGKPTLDAYALANANLVPLAPDSLTTTGTSEAHPNMQPFLVLNICMATVGIFPPRQ